MNSQNDEDRIMRIMNDPEKMKQILQKAVNDALLRHKQAGNPVCELKNGEVSWIQPQDIVINSDKSDL